MQIDFFFQILRRFHPEYLSQSLSALRNFIKDTNLDTFECLSYLYDFIMDVNINDEPKIHRFAKEMRQRIDKRSAVLLAKGERILSYFEKAYRNKGLDPQFIFNSEDNSVSTLNPSSAVAASDGSDFYSPNASEILNLLATGRNFIPYDEFQKKLKNQ